MYPYTLTPKEYTETRNINVIKQWKEQTAEYISIQKNISVDKAKAWVEWALKEGHIKIDDPVLEAFTKDENRDRYETRITLSQYLETVNQRNLILVPTLTSYLSKKKMESMLSRTTQRMFDERKFMKKASKREYARGNKQEASRLNNGQNKKKEGINSISGMLTIQSNCFANRSGHSTLTSVCRIATAFASANVERLFSGRRLFFSGPSVVENIIGILTYVDYKQVENTMQKYNLHYVTPEELYQCLKYSFESYWMSEKWENYIWSFVSKLTPLQCSAYLYMGDFYHVRVFNESFVRSWLDGARDFESAEPLDAQQCQDEISQVDEFYSSVVAMMVSSYIGKYSIYEDIHKEKDYYGHIGARSLYFREYMKYYEDFILTFWCTRHIPAEIAYFPSCIRKSTLGGDTDSNLFTVSQWIEWYHGTCKVNTDTKKTGVILTYYLCMLVKHTLALVSGQIKVEEHHIHDLKMKNEFYFDVFAPSNRTKHYICKSTMCEGQNTDDEIEIKGVSLKNSKANPRFIQAFQDMATEIMNDVAEGKDISYREIVRRIAEMERDIFVSVMYGDGDYLNTRAIKVKEAYNIPMSSDYASYELWEDVFADKYGHTEPPPYIGVRISLDIPNKTLLNKWLDGLEDQVIASNFRKFMDKHDKKSFASIYIPEDIAQMKGIPDELKSVINIRKIIFGNMEQFYILLEMLSIYKVNPWLTRLCLDEHIDLIPEDLRKYFIDMRDDEISKAREEALEQGVELEEREDEIDDYDDDHF